MHNTRRTFMRALAAGGIATAASTVGSAAGETITVTGGGTDIWNREDAGHFYYTPVSGDFDVTVHVADLEATDQWAKAGIMVRQDLTADAENAMLRATPGNGTSLQWRGDDGAWTDSTTSDDVGVGTIEADWLRLVREGDTHTAYGSTDGSNWTRIAQLTASELDMSANTYLGLAVTSHDRGTPCTATFDSLAGVDPTENRDIGDVAVSGNVSRTTSDATIEPGTYRVRNVNSGKYLDVYGAGEDNGTTVNQWSANGLANQRWIVEHLGDGQYRLTAEHSGKVLDVAGGSTDSGADVHQWTWVGGDNQRWRIEDVGDGYRIEAVHSGKVLDVTAGSTGNGANVQQWGWGDQANQTWRFEPVDGGGDTWDGGTASRFALDDGFATPGSWVDDTTEVIRVQEATRSAVEAAVQASGPRVVVFETSGTVDLGGSPLRITNDRCWIAGQTAPSPGITFVNGMVTVDASDCVVQHVRSRIGPGSDGNIQGNDSLNTADGTTNNVIDHVSASWGTDECLSIGYDTTDTTLTNSLIYEGLYDPYGDGTDHNLGTLVGDGADNVTMAGNVWAKCRGRAPRLKRETTSVVANNLMYFFNEATNLDDTTEASLVGNVYVPQDLDDTVIEGGSAYLAGNVTEPSSAPLTGGTTELSSAPLWPEGLDLLATGDVEDYTLANAGARPADRTANDRRIVREIRDRVGDAYTDSPYDYWVPDPSAVGGYPTLPENTHSLSVPDTGLRAWLGQWARAVERADVNPP